MCVDAVDDGRLKLRVYVIFLDDKALRLRALYGAAELVYLLLHFCMLGSFANTFEVGFDLAIELEAVAPRAALEGFLYDITA
jgi:hypothetical protein